MSELTVIGGGLAGCEAAWQAAERGIQVTLYEMRPQKETGAHISADLAELVCSNSLGSNLPDRASGLLKEELRQLGSMLLECAEASSLPAGAALAVDRSVFAQTVTRRVECHPNIRLVREEVTEIPELADGKAVIVASGPLTSAALTRSIQAVTGQGNLFFFDAIAPIVKQDSIDMTIAFRASRFEREKVDEGDYLNCPLNQDEYDLFISELLKAERIPLREFEEQINSGVNAGAHRFFEGCLPIEVMAARGPQSLAFGPMRPIGLTDPRTGRGPVAVVQLRQDNLAGSLYNLVGFQTNLTFPEQNRVLRLIPGLQKAEFVRFGQMHRNTFITAPLVLETSLQLKEHAGLFFAGQIVGVEGYMGNIATGLLAGVNAVRHLQGESTLTLPATTLLGGLVYYITHAELKDFQPMKANYGILPPLKSPSRGKRERAMQYATRGLADLQQWAQAAGYPLRIEKEPK